MLSKAATLLTYVPKYSPVFKSPYGTAILKFSSEYVVETSGTMHCAFSSVESLSWNIHFLSQIVIKLFSGSPLKRVDKPFAETSNGHPPLNAHVRSLVAAVISKAFKMLIYPEAK